MFFSFGRFWAQGYGNYIETVLEKENATLDDLLNEDNILIEIKGPNVKLARFLIDNPENYLDMINYVKQSDEEYRDQLTQMKFPFMASEILGADNQMIIDYLFDPFYEEQETMKQQEEDDTDQEQKEVQKIAQPQDIEQMRKALLPTLLSFLDQDYLNVTAAGYFSKVISSIIKKKGYSFWEYLVLRPIHLSNFIKHIELPQIAELIEKLIALETTEELQNTKYLENRSNLMTRLLKLALNKPSNQECVSNVGYVLSEIVQRRLQVSGQAAKELDFMIDVISKPELLIEIAVNKLQNNLFIQILSNQSIFLTILIYIVESRLKRFQRKASEDQKHEDEFEVLGPKFMDFFPICDRIIQILQSQRLNDFRINTTFGTVQKPFGQMKLQAVELFYVLIKTKESLLIKKFAQTEISNILLDYVIDYQFHNSLQMLFQKIIVTIFDSELYRNLQDAFIDDGLINELSNQLELVKLGDQTLVPGYRGLFIKLSNFLKSRSQVNQYLEESLQKKDWLDYEDGLLKHRNNLEQNFILGINPREENQKEFESDDQQTEQDVQKMVQVNQISLIISKKFQEYNNSQDQQEETGGEQEHLEEEDNQVEDDIKDKIEKVIQSPETKPQEGNHITQIMFLVRELIEFEELNDLQHTPEEKEAHSDSQVNKYWKSHERQSSQENEEIERDDYSPSNNYDASPKNKQFNENQDQHENENEVEKENEDQHEYEDENEKENKYSNQNDQDNDLQDNKDNELEDFNNENFQDEQNNQ